LTREPSQCLDPITLCKAIHHSASSLSHSGVSLQGVTQLKEFCKKFKVWQDPEVDLRGIALPSNLSTKQKNEELLRAFPSFATCVRVNGASPFYSSPSIVEELELQVLKELPTGDVVFFPFAPITQPLT